MQKVEPCGRWPSLGHIDTAEALGCDDAHARVDAPAPKLSVLFALADKVVANAVTDNDIEAAQSAGHSPKDIEDVIFVSSLFGFANRMVTGFGIDYVKSRDQLGSRRLAEGYVWKRA